jgi:hypothetical protein
MHEISVTYQQNTKSWLIYMRPFRTKERATLQTLFTQLGLRRSPRLERELRELLGTVAALVHADVFTRGYDRCTILRFKSRTDASMSWRSRRLNGEEFASIILSNNQT